MSTTTHEIVTQAILLQRGRARANDLQLRFITSAGLVLSLYLRNGRGSVRRLAGLDNGFGISEIRWRPQGESTGALVSIERHIPASWLGLPQAYAWYAAVVELLAHEVRPGMLEPLLASHLMGVVGSLDGPGPADFLRILTLLGHGPDRGVTPGNMLALVRDRLGLSAPYLGLALGGSGPALEMA